MVKKEPYIGMPIILGDYDNVPREPGPVIVENNRNNNTSSMDLGNLPVAMSYTPMQNWTKTYDIAEGFSVGTIFPQLNLPFKGYQGGMSR